jgi:hypothetical protein
MPVLIIAVVFFLIFLVMGVLGFSAMAAEHKGHLFSWHWSDLPKPAKVSPNTKASARRAVYAQSVAARPSRPSA